MAAPANGGRTAADQPYEYFFLANGTKSFVNGTLVDGVCLATDQGRSYFVCYINGENLGGVFDAGAVRFAGRLTTLTVSAPPE